MERARLIVKSDKGDSDSESDFIDFQFNPKELSLSKSASWNASPSLSKNHTTPVLEFGGVQARTLTVQMHFDCYDSESNGSSISSTLARLYSTMTPTVDQKHTEEVEGADGGEPTTSEFSFKRPPYVQLKWGNWLQQGFTGVVSSISQKHILFGQDGKELRAIVDLSLTEASELSFPAQNPTSGGYGGEQLWEVSEGETLQWISYKALGSSTQWRSIARENGLHQVRDIPVGTQLVIPNRTLNRGTN